MGREEADGTVHIRRARIPGRGKGGGVAEKIRMCVKISCWLIASNEHVSSLFVRRPSCCFVGRLYATLVPIQAIVGARIEVSCWQQARFGSQDNGCSPCQHSPNRQLRAAGTVLSACFTSSLQHACSFVFGDWAVHSDNSTDIHFEPFVDPCVRSPALSHAHTDPP